MLNYIHTVWFPPSRECRRRRENRKRQQKTRRGGGSG